MKYIALATLLSSLIPQFAAANTGIKIIGGTKSQGHNFFLNLSMDGTLDTAFCGSTAIAPGVAVTAAHCVASKTRKFKLIHGIKQDGVNDLTVIDVKAVVSHQAYKGTANDIALIFFDEEQARGKVVPAKTNKGQVDLYNGAVLTAIGRGNLTSIGTLYGNDLFEVNIPYIDNSTCKEVKEYEGAITTFHECAGVEDGGKDSCQGDSGGPLVSLVNGEATLVGVTNFGLGCGQKGLPGVYASLKAHSSWVESNIARYNNNETVASPNMNLAFASKCYLVDAQEEVLQQQNTNDAGALSISSLYLPKSRFLKSSTLYTPGSKKICEFSLGDKSYEAIADTVQSKIIIKNTSSSEMWVASSERNTDSLYQRCMQTAPMAINFDIAVGSGDAMINLNNSIARLVPIDAAQVPADNNSVGGCTIGKYETVISTSQSAQAILVTLKNHINDMTTVFVMGGGSGAGTATGPKPGTLSASLDVSEGSSAVLVIDNQSDQDLFTWELKCNKDFSFLNKNKVDSKTIRYLAGSDIDGVVLRDEKLEININFAAASPNADGQLKCAINRDVQVSIK